MKQSTYVNTTPSIRFEQRCNITISVCAKKFLGLKDGDKVAFIQERERWFICTDTGEYTVITKNEKKASAGGESLRVFSRNLSEKIRESIFIPSSFNMSVGKETSPGSRKYPLELCVKLEKKFA